MGILNNAFGLIPDKQINKSEMSKNDFPEGFRITEIINGKPDNSNTLSLLGTFMPKDTFDHGKAQRVQKEWYAGSKHPSIQVLGGKEDDVSIKGCFDEKFLKDLTLSGAAEEYKKRIEQIVDRGNIVLIQLGDYWKRYCILEDANFKMHHLKKIDYEIKINIIGTALPKNYYFVDGSEIETKAPRADLIAKTAAHLKLLESKPTSMPVTVSDLINSTISDVAGKVKIVTDFVNGVLDDAEKITDATYRAVGLITNARSFIAKSNRRLGSVGAKASVLAPTLQSELDKTKAVIENLAFIHSVKTSNKSMNKSLVDLQNKFNSFIKTLPLKRHLVIDGDSLQKISIKYYGTADHWKDIMDFNKLSVANLTIGSVLNIPRI